MSKIQTLLILIVFLLGFSFGYFTKFLWSSKKNYPNKEIVFSQKECEPIVKKVENLDNHDNHEVSIKRLDLLKDYINFVLMPKKKIVDIKKYVLEMNQKADEIGDPELSEKYSATGEDENREQRILDFFNFSISKVKAELEK